MLGPAELQERLASHESMLETLLEPAAKEAGFPGKCPLAQMRPPPPPHPPMCAGTYEGFFWAHCGWLMHSKVGTWPRLDAAPPGFTWHSAAAVLPIHWPLRCLAHVPAAWNPSPPLPAGAELSDWGPLDRI